jgi:hypothetical protein
VPAARAAAMVTSEAMTPRCAGAARRRKPQRAAFAER